MRSVCLTTLNKLHNALTIVLQGSTNQPVVNEAPCPRSLSLSSAHRRSVPLNPHLLSEKALPALDDANRACSAGCSQDSAAVEKVLSLVGGCVMPN